MAGEKIIHGEREENGNNGSQQPTHGGMQNNTHHANLARNDSRTAIVRKHQQKVLEELKQQERQDIKELGETKLPVSDNPGTSKREGAYQVKESSTHVTKILTTESTIKLRVKQLLAGAGSGVITKTAVAPLERTKILLQVQGMRMKDKPKSEFKYKGIYRTMATVVREEGFLSLYAGNGANCVRVIPVYALKFTFNSTFKDLVRTPGEDLSYAQLIAAGTMAGLFQTCVTYPLETIRTRLTLGAGLGVKYKGIWDCGKTIIQTEGGVRALYKGIGPTFLSGSPYVGLQMSSYEVLKRRFENDSDSQGRKQLLRLSAGALAGVFAQTVTYPGDTIRRRMQMNGANGEAKLYRNSWDCGKKLIKAEGVAGLFSGLTANLIRCVPGAAIQFWSFDFLNSLLEKV